MRAGVSWSGCPSYLVAETWRPVYPQLREQSEERLRRVERVRQSRVNANAVFVSLLDADSRRRYSSARAVEVTGSAGGRYVLAYGFSANVFAIDEHGDFLACYCAHPSMKADGVEGDLLPIESAMVAQLLTLRVDEPGFLAVAHRMPLGIGAYLRLLSSWMR
jgi:hypothetical protein